MERFLMTSAIVFCAIFPMCLADERLQVEHVDVSYGGIDKAYAEAIARTVATARGTAAEQFGFDMPETIAVTITADPKANVRLFNDGQDRFSLTVRSGKDLRKPSATGIFHIYGMCHEVGHLAMYRLIRDHSWMTPDAAEGWAHYLGSRLVDAVHAKEGADLWPDRYDYLEDGTKRLEGQLKSGKANATIKTAALWKELTEVVGDKGVAPIFRAFDKATFDPADPTEGMGKALQNSEVKQETLAWWEKAKDALVLKRPKSEFVPGAVKKSQVSGKARELAHDDGKPAGTKSFAGGGHAVRFETPEGDWCVTGVRIFGSRYGSPEAPKEDFHLWLCDKDLKAIADYSYPYSEFPWGEPRWVAFKVQPTRVPSEFIVCGGFNPTATKGVFVHHDGGASGKSLSGLPGEGSAPFQDGDWMIRVVLAKLKGGKSSK